MNVQDQNPHRSFDIAADGVLLSAITVIEKTTLAKADREERAQLWIGIHQTTKARLVTAVARFFIDHEQVTIHNEPPYTFVSWNEDPNAVAYVLGAMAYRHRDLTHMLPEPVDYREGEWIRLHTKCGCESRTMRYPSPLPLLIHKSTVDGRVRTFKRGATNAFGATVYTEA